MKLKFSSGAITLLFLMFTNMVLSQSEVTDTTKKIDLSEVEITATSNSKKSILNQPASIVKLNEVELKRNTGLFLDDAINTNVPGVFMERRSFSGGQQINIRGYGNGARGTNGVSSNFDGQGAKVYLNGIPITDAEGITVMDDIDFGSINSTEVTKGPAGTLYGMAIAGVLNLQTRKAEKGKVSIGQEAMFGSYGLQRFTTQVEIGGENSSVLINYGHQQSDGFITHTASKKDFVNMMGDFHLNQKQTVTTYFGYSNSYDERQGELTINQYDSLIYTGNPAYIKNDAHSAVTGLRAGIGHKYQFNKHVSNSLTVFGSGLSTNASSAGGWTDKTPVNYGARTTFDFNMDLNDKFSLGGIIGGEIQQQNAAIAGYGMVTNPDPSQPYNIIGALRSNQITKSQTYCLFTEWTLQMPKDWSFTAGIGSSSMLITLEDRFYVANNTKPTKYSKGYDGMNAPHFALNKIFKKHYSAYISYSTGYKAPVSSYFFIPTTGEVNTNLKPEMGTQLEIGTKGDILQGKLHYEVAVFNAIFSDKMTTVAVPLSPPAVGTAYSYVTNRGSQDDKGLEILLKYTAYHSEEGFFKDIKPFANFTYSNFKYTGYSYQTLSSDKKSVVEVDYSGNAVAGVAPMTANAGIDVSTKSGLYGNVSYSYRDAMPFTSDGKNIAAAYSLLNAKIGFHKLISKHFDLNLYVGANNITGTQYSYMVFVNQLPDAYLPAPYEINFFGGLNLKYIF